MLNILSVVGPERQMSSTKLGYSEPHSLAFYGDRLLVS
ncbi:hypothetical protein Pan181_22040 [Aeoliella mucimassa]|uniref:Uncharacterized protein n=1 Tax=Aeoliella mucimassa TaxID=2527972 RepID=A0A518AMQ1_9BACT|nr:hypothetical protein Pan181_22040 [Aeoliella mucimassa]